MTRVLIGLLHVYRRWISPAFPPSCRYTPTCSHYAIEALEQRGLLVGMALAVWRVLRCHPFVRGGYDPVPIKDARLSRTGANQRAQILRSAKTTAPRSG